MKSVYTNKEVANQLQLDVKTVAAIGRDVLFVPRGGNSYMWTLRYIKKLKKIISYGKGEMVEL